jgi:hypothetical protein
MHLLKHSRLLRLLLVGRKVVLVVVRKADQAGASLREVLAERAQAVAKDGPHSRVAAYRVAMSIEDSEA